MRTTVRIAAILALVIASQALAASQVDYVVELGGDPNVTSYEGGAYPEYTRGSASDYPAATADYEVGDTINWSVVATVSGAHSGTLGDGYVPAGLANIVCSLELKDNGGTTVALERISGTANTPTSAGWYSVINDGDADGARGLIETDPLANAAFTTVFNINGNMANGGRIFDTAANGGPLMGKTDTTPSVDSYSYPSCTGLPANAEDCGGLLVGMGAGYSSFVPAYLGGPNTSGVGLVGTSESAAIGLGEKPLIEGQISTIGLAAGTYTLTVTPGDGHEHYAQHRRLDLRRWSRHVRRGSQRHETAPRSRYVIDGGPRSPRPPR